ncbi:hypothetical protein [Aestuariivita sp.]|uniref:hypothetical protein n=1 Tax=Aestuariivita sp. TaxID=1872407 RepID=UPI0021727B28|nr:hypothetical protein [Aestuariivita sp.]MCE8008592.1 hypothetical protein [Aestuariivita sp.]
MISAAPVTVIVLGIIIWGVVWILYRQRLDAVKELLSIKDTRIAEFQTKTSAQTPDEAAERIAKLERRIEEVANKPATWG